MVKSSYPILLLKLTTAATLFLPAGLRSVVGLDPTLSLNSAVKHTKVLGCSEVTCTIEMFVSMAELAVCSARAFMASARRISGRIKPGCGDVTRLKGSLTKSPRGRVTHPNTAWAGDRPWENVHELMVWSTATRHWSSSSFLAAPRSSTTRSTRLLSRAFRRSILPAEVGLSRDRLVENAAAHMEGGHFSPPGSVLERRETEGSIPYLQQCCQHMRWLSRLQDLGGVARSLAIDHPEVDDVGLLALTAEQKQYCTPIEGRETERSGECCDGLVDAILKGIYQEARRRNPAHFTKKAHEVMFARPVPDALMMWSPASPSATRSRSR